MGKPLSRPGCFRKSSCCLEKHGLGDGGVGGRDLGMEGGYGDGYVPQRSIYDTMCINQQIDNHHHHSGGLVRRDGGGDGSFSYSMSGSLRVSRSDMFDPQPRCLTPNPSFVQRLDERAIYDSLKLGAEDIDGCHPQGHLNRSVSPSVSSFSAPGVSSSSKKHHNHHHHHGDSTKSRESRHSWKAMSSPKPLECVEIPTPEMMDRGGGGGYLNPGHYPAAGQSSSLTSPLISPFSGSPLSTGYHTPVFFSPAKPRPSQSQSLRCSPPHVIQPRHYSQTQSLRLSPPHELRRSPYRAPLVQLSAHDLEQDLRERGSGWGRGERDRDWEREREREMERGWAQREWERERERGRLERERARERERRETSTFGTFGYGRPVPLRSDRDSVFIESDHGLDTTPLLLPQPSASPSPSPSGAPRMGTGAVGRNRAGSKVGPEGVGGGMFSRCDSGSVSLMLVDCKSGCGPRLVSEVITGNISEAELRSGNQEHNQAESWNKFDNGSRSSVKNKPEKRMGSQVKTRPGGRDLEGKVQSGMEHKAEHKRLTESVEKTGGDRARQERLPEPKKTSVNEKNVDPVDKVQFETTVIHESQLELQPAAKINSQPEENRVGTEDEPELTSNVVLTSESRVEAKPDPKIAPVSKSGAKPEAAISDGGVKESESDNQAETKGEPQPGSMAGDTPETAPVDQEGKKLEDTDTPKSSHALKSSRSKSKSSKSCSRSRPGTATGMRPGVLSPRESKRLGDFDSTAPPEGTEFTWPRRVMVRKRTVRQGGALHNLPILPPLPSVLSALEKRHPHLRHGSENPLSNLMNPIVGRCSLREPAHPEPGQGSGLVGRASLREQNLEHWRVCREQEEPRRSRSRDKRGEQNKEKAEKQEKKEKEEKKEEPLNNEKEAPLDIKQDKVEMKVEEKNLQNNLKNKEKEKETDLEIKSEKLDDIGIQIKVGSKEVQEQENGAESKLNLEGEADGRYRTNPAVEGGVEGWDAVLDMVNTLWDDSWEKHEAGGEDADSPPGSLQCWPLLRPPIGFGGSHPPSSAASELSLTELERRARELDSDLEHLDLSEPHKDLYQPPMEPGRERADMYQTHPGPQRDKTPLHTGVCSRSQVSLELNVMASTPTDTDRTTSDWSKSASTPTVGLSSNKEDSSPDSNLTLESDSSGVFLSLSNQSQEDAGSDSDQPISGSELGSSNTSLEKDGEDGGLKEWGREESSELQWCYPSLLNTPSNEDVDGCGVGEESGCAERGLDEEEIKTRKIPPEQIDIMASFSAIHREEPPPRKKVTVMGVDPPLPLSPSKQQIKHLLNPYQKPLRSSGLDCGDLDPFVQSDSFVYLAVSARSPSKGEAAAEKEITTHNAKQDNVGKQLEANVQLPNMEADSKMGHLAPLKPEEGDFLCTDSFVYLAAPACLLLGPAGTTTYSGKESDSESSGSGPVDVSFLGCGSVAGDSDWDSDLSDSDPSRSSRVSAGGLKCAGAGRSKRAPAESDWDMFGDATEPEVLGELFLDQDRSSNGKTGQITNRPAAAEAATESCSESPTLKTETSSEQMSTSKKVTWQFKPAQRSVCTGSRKEKDLPRLPETGGGDGHRPSPSSSSSSSPSSSSSG
ncbi:uncharacterized protein LOC119785399 [Cyprinodon tularosa]|uniref:uncharacterized protein LOC119785399 n=1 Tax=Cyprinodon tularosa TaxID=77115 RepID=UPI0018E22ED1|nr:uncharacterized protein LOC119785399 [Cyprinodon tularosa]XP_038143992.1 uncharacterized protein LOC119785399 [Cyprinodon tularosa]XP_038144002.1 uncharacterized protein LOC119785399 [Cyprinodon tularosa]